MLEKTVLIVTSHFYPNIGGVETHLNDLVGALKKRKWNVVVATYTPLARSIESKLVEKSDNLTIYRLPWIGYNIVHKLTPYPLLEFLYLFPGLFLISLFAVVKNPKICVIHAQGLVPAVVGLFVGVITGRRKIVSTHNLYFFPKEGIYKKISKIVFSSMDKVLCLSKGSINELIKIGVPENKISLFRYWLDLDTFKPSKKKIKNKKFNVFFVGRLIETKGVEIILNLVKSVGLKYFSFQIAGTGPMEDEVKIVQRNFENLEYLGFVPNQEVRNYMQKADIVLVPSLVDEGYGRVAMEALSCGVPVVASDMGGLNEVIDDSVGYLVKPNTKSFRKCLEEILKNKEDYIKKRKMTRKYALRNFSERNVEEIMTSYV